jgi:uncharacterized membrane protein YhaH (DUF805 family)
MYIMADTTIPTPQQAIDSAQQSVQQVSDQVQAQAQQIANTAKELAQDPTKAVGMVADQVTNLWQAVGAKELLQDTTGRLIPMKDFVLHTLKMAFFLDPQKRASRGEFVVGWLASFIVLSIVSAILPILLWGIGLFLSMVISMLPVLNLGVKRFHDMNKPSRWALMVLIPLFWWIMPGLFKGENENNPYWPDPVLKAPTDSQWYIIIVLSLFIVSSVITTVLGFLGINVSAPSADSLTDIDSAVNQTQQLKNNTVNTATKTTQKVTQ